MDDKQRLIVDVETAIHSVIWRWYNARLLRFNSHDDGSDDLLLSAEIRKAVMKVIEGGYMT